MSLVLLFYLFQQLLADSSCCDSQSNYTIIMRPQPTCTRMKVYKNGHCITLGDYLVNRQNRMEMNTFCDYNGWRCFTDLGSAAEVAAEQICQRKASENLATEDDNENTGE